MQSHTGASYLYTSSYLASTLVDDDDDDDDVVPMQKLGSLNQIGCSCTVANLRARNNSRNANAATVQGSWYDLL